MARDNGRWRHGLFAGWEEYRYGAKRGRPVTLPGIRPQPPVFSGGKRKAVVAKTIDLLAGWNLTPFENEATTVAGIRSGLCLSEVDFHRADREARALVDEALRRVGASRPRWHEGQPDQSELVEFCRTCKGPLDDECMAKRLRYCSAECARIAYEKRSFALRNTLDRDYNCVAEAIQIFKNPARNCACCGKLFRHRSAKAEYCSLTCAARHRGRSNPRMTIECAWCGDAFATSDKRAQFCCNPCRTMASRAARGRLKRITPNLLDFVFRGAGLRITDGRAAA